MWIIRSEPLSVKDRPARIAPPLERDAAARETCAEKLNFPRRGSGGGRAGLFEQPAGVGVVRLEAQGGLELLDGLGPAAFVQQQLSQRGARRQEVRLVAQGGAKGVGGLGPAALFLQAQAQVEPGPRVGRL